MKRFIHAFRSIRSRMWTALALLASATMLVGLVAWFTLDQANSDLNNLHQQTLSEVARALNLSKRSAALSTSAPHLLNLSSTYRINEEGRQLIALLDDVKQDWIDGVTPGEQETDFSRKILLALSAMHAAISDLIATSEMLDGSLQEVHRANAELSALRNTFSAKMRPANIERENRLNWLALQSMANHALGAGYVGNLLGVGEHHRNFVNQQGAIQTVQLNAQQSSSYQKVLELSAGPEGIFELRRRELALNLSAQNALFRIRYNAGQISELTGELAAQAELFLSQRRDESSSSIAFAKTLIISIGITSILIAVLSAIYFSSYVTSNISLISNAMKRLAAGDRAFELTKTVEKQDEIGDFFRSFRVFRANALRLDRSNDQLHRRNALFEKVFNNISDGVAITDARGRLSASNPSFATILRIPTESTLKREISGILGTSHFARAAANAQLRGDFQGFMELQSEDGQVIEIRSTPLPDAGRVWLLSDATERKRIDERLNEIRRIESLGKVTGEVAHDFGNILSTISSNLYLLESEDLSEKSQGMRQRISNAVEIGTSLTQRLLAFARKQHLEPELTELNSLVEGLTDLISIGLKDSVALRTDLWKNELYVKVDPGQLESAIFNLCLNSNQAIEGPGHIAISVRPQSKGTAVIIVSDNGIGMDDATKSQSMEPFFSARQDGEGTGLGLSMVYGFIKQTGGDIQIDSAPGTGTRVQISLPMTDHPQETVPERRRLSKRALLIEDDPIALSAATQYLTDLGLTVVPSASFQKGLDYLKGGPNIDFLVTDIQLDGGESGWALAQYALERSASIQVIVVSGRLPADHPLQKQYADRLTCLSKPYDIEVLKQAIRNEKQSKSLSVV